jgi:transcriptional regulator with XRE-family HTH domain
MRYDTPEKAMKRLGERLKSAREEHGLTQEDIVERLGKKTTASISEYESGKRKLAAAELPEFARALDVPIIYFFKEELTAQDDMESFLLQWFRRLPDERKPRVFKMLEAIERLEPLIIGEMPSEAQTRLNEPRSEYKAKGRKK